MPSNQWEQMKEYSKKNKGSLDGFEEEQQAKEAAADIFVAEKNEDGSWDSKNAKDKDSLIVEEKPQE